MGQTFPGEASPSRGLPNNSANPLPWQAYQGNEFVEHKKLVELLDRTWKLDRHEAQAWEALDANVELPTSTPRSPSVKTPKADSLQLWRGVPDPWKEELWRLASGAPVGGPIADAEAYQQALAQAFGDRVPEHFEQCPLFCEASDMAFEQDGLRQCVPFSDYLSPTGILAAHRILWCCSQLWWTEVEFCPVIPVLVCILLVFFKSEASVYAVIRSVLIRASKDFRKRSSAPEWEAQEPFPFLPFTRAQWNDASRRAAAFAVGQMPEEAAHLQSLGVDLDAIAARALRDGLVSFLPFRAVCRVYGIFLADGFQVFVQYLVAFWLHRRGLLRHCRKLEVAQSWLLPVPVESGVIESSTAPSGDQLSRVDSMNFELLRSTCSATGGKMLGVDDLSQLALAISIPKSLSDVKVSSSLPPCLEGSHSAGRIHVRPRLQGERSHIIWDALWPYIWQWLPPTCLLKEPFLSFQSRQHGYNLSSLLHKCEKAPPDMPMVLIVRVRALLAGELPGGGSGPEAVIGAFLPAALCVTGRGYISLCETPVWSSVVYQSYVFAVPTCPDGSHGTPKAWYWTGRNEMAFDAPATGEVLFIGGDSAALRLNKELRSGTTRACASFGSPPLLQKPTSTMAEPNRNAESDTMLPGNENIAPQSPDSAAKGAPKEGSGDDSAAMPNTDGRCCVDASGFGDDGKTTQTLGAHSYVDYDILEVEVFELRDDSREEREGE